MTKSNISPRFNFIYNQQNRNDYAFGASHNYYSFGDMSMILSVFKAIMQTTHLF